MSSISAKTVLDQFRYHVVKQQNFFQKITQNLPPDFQFCPYERVWSYHATPEYSRQLQIDIFARAGKGDYSIIGEVKNRESKKFSLKEAEAFEKKLSIVKEVEKLDKTLGFLFSLLFLRPSNLLNRFSC